jgi:hydrogenase maturation protease
MHQQLSPPKTLVVGIGSPYGDDQAGWLIAHRISQSIASHPLQTNLEVQWSRSPIDLLSWLTNQQRLIICDACQGLDGIGSFRRWSWPTTDLDHLRWSGTHDFSIVTALLLAERLHRLPQDVSIWGVEGLSSNLDNTSVSPEVAETVELIANKILAELSLPIPSGDALCMSNL